MKALRHLEIELSELTGYHTTVVETPTGYDNSKFKISFTLGNGKTLTKTVWYKDKLDGCADYTKYVNVLRHICNELDI